MANWREHILKHFQRNISRLTLVADPDGLLTAEGMLSAIQDRGFDLIPFDDAIAFRFAYESQYRSLWDTGQQTDVVVVLRSAEQQLSTLPFDLLQAGRQLTFALHQLFPTLNYPVIAGLDRTYLDAIDASYQQHNGKQLTERDTKEFVLMHCFSIVPQLIKTPVELLKVLLSLHARRVHLPDILNAYLLESLTKDATFAMWPLTDIVPNREKFLRFLQDEWNVFLASLGDPSRPCRVPFNHEDVRAYTDTLFLDGSLTPVAQDNVANLPAWVRTGVVHDLKADALRRFRGLRQQFETDIPSADVSHRAWQHAAQRWAELVVLRWEWDEALGPDDRTAWRDVHAKVEEAFGQWMMHRYGTLHNLPYSQQPVMVHQIARFMAVERTRKKLAKIALLVLDGLAFDQWLILRKHLESGDPAWRFQESTAFAWVPTLTSVSRQSIFAGEPPLYFPDSLETTSKEKAHWQRFWEDHGVQRAGVELVTNLDGPTDPKLESALANPRLAVLGIVWNKVDDIIHGMQMQTAGMHNQVRLWASQGHLHHLLMRLQHEGFVIYLTADHGNVTATGVGNPREGVLAETRGERARVYDRPAFRDEVAAKFPASMRWPNYGLPPTRHVLLAGGLQAFTDDGDAIVAHGGITLEEVLVPFVAITREDPVKVVGISQKIKRAWLDAVLDRLVQTIDEANLRMFLDQYLREELPGPESRAKTSGIILRIWSGIPRARLALRDRAVALLPHLSGQERIWLHWGMTALAYPFFRDTAEVVGRLLALQDDCTTAQVQARMMTTWGDRATSKEAAQKLITTLVDWEVLRSTKTKGHFLLARKMTASIPALQLWLLEALLGASAADEIEAQQLLRLPEVFPFRLDVGVADLRKHEGFNIHRQGLDMDVVALHQVKGEPPPKPMKKPKQEKAAQPVQPSLFEQHTAEVVSGHGQSMPVVPVTTTTVMVLVPDAPFAAPSAECAAQFRDGYYFGCIALTQAVLEAVVRHIWQVQLKKKPKQAGTFAKNLDTLHKKQCISDAWKTRLDQMWADRHTFHHLRPFEESDRQKLAATARHTLKLLNELQQAFFGFTVREGIVIPAHPEYWSIKDGESLVFMRGHE